MRLSAEQTEIILDITRQRLGEGMHVRVYGSRLDEARSGGDLDLLIEAPHRIDILQCAELKLLLEAALQLPVDVLLYQSGTVPSAFQSIALAQAVELESAA